MVKRMNTKVLWKKCYLVIWTLVFFLYIPFDYFFQQPDTGYPEKQPPEAEMTTKEQRDRQQAEVY